METVQLIIECTQELFPEESPEGARDEPEKKINSFCKIKYRLPMIQSYVIEIPASAVHTLYGVEGIKAVHQNAYITAQMNIARKDVNTDAAHARRLTGQGVGIAILDTGVAPVDDLTLPQNRIVAFQDMVNGAGSPYDDNGHGTHVWSRRA